MTILESARKGVITSELKIAAAYDRLPPEKLAGLVAGGVAVVPKNRNHDFSYIRAIGKGLSVKVNANIGTSDSAGCINSELEKLDEAVRSGADAVMDLSTAGDLPEIRRQILDRSPLMVGTVPVYSLPALNSKNGPESEKLHQDDFLKELEQHAKAGVDFVTLHAGITGFVLQQLENSKRCLGMVSRGGALIKRWMKETGNENPFYKGFADVLDICRRYEVTLSLGDGLRPGATADAGDRAQIAELVILGELADKARQAGVQVMVEGPGHVPYSDIDMHVRLMKRLCGNAPAYVLGPLPVDIAAGHDHITAAIGGAAAACAGADFLCYVTPAEHLCLPDVEDVRQGVMASRIAAHIGDINRGDSSAAHRDLEISRARRDLDWERIFEYSLDQELSRRRKGPADSDCTMCGHLCAIRNDKA